MFNVTAVVGATGAVGTLIREIMETLITSVSYMAIMS